MNALPAELQAIRERDARWQPHRPQTTVADYDRRTLLALYDAHDAERLRLSDEVRKLRQLLAMAVDDIAEWAAYASGYFQEKHDLAGTLARYRAALGSQP